MGQFPRLPGSGHSHHRLEDPDQKVLLERVRAGLRAAPNNAAALRGRLVALFYRGSPHSSFSGERRVMQKNMKIIQAPKAHETLQELKKFIQASRTRS